LTMSLAISRLLYSTWVSLPLGLELLPYPDEDDCRVQLTSLFPSTPAVIAVADLEDPGRPSHTARSSP
jgi:hypothetical protein